MTHALGPISRFPIALFSARTKCRWAGMSLLLGLCVAGQGTAAALQEEGSGPAVIFTKDFPGSTPAYYSVTVREGGEAVFRTDPETDPDAEAPVEFRLPSEASGEIFSLARKLNRFQGLTLESKRRVANMGKKTLGYDDGAEHFASSFNHTEVPEALALLGLFERVAQTQQHALRLEYLMQFDRLGLVKALLQLEIDLDQGQLVGPAQLVPVLEQVLKDRAVAQLAKGRAAQILGKMQAAKPQLPSGARSN